MPSRTNPPVPPKARSARASGPKAVKPAAAVAKADAAQIDKPTPVPVAKAPKPGRAPVKPAPVKPAQVKPTAPTLFETPKIVAAATAPVELPPVPTPAAAKLTLVASTEKSATSTEPTVKSTDFLIGYEEFASLGQENFDALVKANTALAKGFEDFGKEIVSSAQASLEKATSLAGAIMAAKTIKELVDLTTSLTRSGIEMMVADSSKFSELSIQLTREAFAPLNAHMSAAIGKMLDRRAA